MRAELIWRPRALDDLIEIYVYIGLDSEAAAERIYRRLEERVLLLAEQPHMGPRRRDLAPTARMLVEGNFLILYECEPDTDLGSVDRVEIVRIVDARREMTRVVF